MPVKEDPVAADIDAILRNIECCYDFTGKSVIHVGAGGGQLVGYAGRARAVLGVDSDAGAVERLKEGVRQRGLADRFRVVQGDFLTLSTPADVVFFEFCLHEIPDPRAALLHARALGPETLVADHAPESRWTWYLCETEKVQGSWAAVEELHLILDRRFEGVQRFLDHAELLAKVQALGESVVRRVERFEGRRDFTIDMPYRVALRE